MFAPVDRSRAAQAALAFTALVAVSFFPALSADFVWDDLIITGSEMVKDPNGLYRIWFTPGDGGINEAHYWPIIYSTFWLEYRLWGFNAVVSHAINMALHALNTWLLFRVLVRLQVPGAFLCALIFAVHPVHVESVVWVIERKDLLSGVFYFATALAWFRFLEDPRLWRYLLTFALLILGMLSKSVVVTLPAVLLVVQWWKVGRVTATDIARLLPFFVATLAISFGDVWFFRSLTDLTFDLTWVDRVLIAGRSLWFYFAKILLPINLTLVYPFWDVSMLHWLYLVAALALAAVLWLLRSRIGRGPLAGGLFFAIALSPTLGIVDHSFLEFSYVADRYQYLAMIGPIAVIVGGIASVLAPALAGNGPSMQWTAPRLAAGAAAVALLAVLGTLTWRQAEIYHDNIRLFEHIVAHNPEARGAHTALCKFLREEGRLDEAVAAGYTAIELDPNEYRARINLGLALRHRGDLDEAEAQYRTALTLSPGNESILRNLLTVLWMQQRSEDVDDVARRLMSRYPNSPVSLAAIAYAMMMLERYEQAEVYYRRSLAFNPGHAVNAHNLGETLRRQQRYEEALEWFGTGMRLNPAYTLSYIGAADTLFYLGRLDEARDLVNRALAMEPNSSLAQTVRDRILAKMQQGE